jgi:hypothetical protein
VRAVNPEAIRLSKIEAVKNNACEKILQGPQLAFKLIAKEKPFFHDLVLLKRC